VSARVRRAAQALVVAGLLATSAARAQDPAPAPPDTLEQFLGELSDSTDAYFGRAAAPLDTAGLDSVLSDRLSGEPLTGVTWSVLPAFAFNRVDGPVPGITLGLAGPRRSGAPIGWGRLGVKLGYATGPNDLLGGVEYLSRVRIGTAPLDVRLFAGRVTTGMNRDHRDRFLGTVRAFLTGNDRQHYLRNDGFEGSVGREDVTWHARLGYRDLLQSPLPVTATWNLFHREPTLRTNLPATFGRLRELELAAGARLPSALPARAEVTWQHSDPALGSDFDYQRVRAAIGAELPVGRALSVVPQLAYGRLTGDTIPQAAFYMGGGPTLRSVVRDSRGGTRMAIAKLDVISAQDLLTVLHIKHPAALPLQGGVFAAAGAVWGYDPYGGPAIGGDALPDAENWLTEAGVSLLYSTGLLDGAIVRFNYAWPLGPNDRKGKISISIAHALDLLRTAGE
jgi:hypothetical protein